MSGAKLQESSKKSESGATGFFKKMNDNNAPGMFNTGKRSQTEWGSFKGAQNASTEWGSFKGAETEKSLGFSQDAFPSQKKIGYKQPKLLMKPESVGFSQDAKWDQNASTEWGSFKGAEQNNAKFPLQKWQNGESAKFTLDKWNNNAQFPLQTWKNSKKGSNSARFTLQPWQEGYKFQNGDLINLTSQVGQTAPYKPSPDAIEQTTAEMQIEQSRLEQLKGSKFLKDTFSQYDKDVSKYFDDLFASMRGKNSNKVQQRFNTMIDNVMFKNLEKEKLELADVKKFMKEHDWASLDNVDSVIKKLYSKKLQDIKAIVAKMGYTNDRQNLVVDSVREIIKQSVSTQIMTFQFIYAQYILFKTIQSYINITDSVEKSINSVVTSMVQPDVASGELNKTQQKLIQKALDGYYARLNTTKEMLKNSVA